MFPRGSLIFRLLAVLVLAGILLAAGWGVYRFGYAQGFAQGAAISPELPEGQAPGLRPYYPGFYGPRSGFFPFFPLFGLFFAGLFIFWILGWIFRPRDWGSRGGWYGHPHHWGPPGEGPGQPQGSQPPAEPAPTDH